MAFGSQPDGRAVGDKPCRGAVARCRRGFVVEDTLMAPSTTARRREQAPGGELIMAGGSPTTFISGFRSPPTDDGRRGFVGIIAYPQLTGGAIA